MAQPAGLLNESVVRNRRRGGFVAAVLLIVAWAVFAPAPQQEVRASNTESPASTIPTTYVVTVADEAKIRALLVQLGDAKGDDRRKILDDLAHTGDQRLESTFQRLNEGSLYAWNDQVVVVRKLEPVADSDEKRGALLDALTGEPMLDAAKSPLVVGERSLKQIEASRRDRILVRDALVVLRLFNANRAERLAAVIKAGDGGNVSLLPVLEDLAKVERDRAIRSAVAESIALIKLTRDAATPEAAAERLAAVNQLGVMRSARALSRLEELHKATTDTALQQALHQAMDRIKSWQNVVEWSGTLFSGMSASSILILIALGLSITFGLMGVINMAHGELVMVGAYATYIMQVLFVKYLPADAFNWYFVAAIPFSFVCAALVGLVLEATVIRFLYGRPLETLLATFGVGYVLVQIIRLIFGDNIGVNSPTWLRGSFEIVQDVRLPYNRLFIIVFCLACIALMYLIIEKTRLGLLMRATTQNRQMASALGVSTRRIDMLTFALGAGLAGLAGCALTQVGGVTPDMGSNYIIIDSFLVVVTGGVGKLAGAIWAGLGLGTTNKLLEPYFATVWAKVIILVLVVLFIQWRPSGLFPAKGRLADV